MFMNTIKYLNRACKKIGLEARLHLGGRSDTAADGIYFYRPPYERLNALPAAELDKILQERRDELDHGTIETIQQYSDVNDCLVNKGARYIPLGKCDEVEKLLGT